MDIKIPTMWNASLSKEIAYLIFQYRSQNPNYQIDFEKIEYINKSILFEIQKGNSYFNEIMILDEFMVKLIHKYYTVLGYRIIISEKESYLPYHAYQVYITWS